jgi:hypothetical protein
MTEKSTVSLAEARANAAALLAFWRTGKESHDRLAKLKSGALSHGSKAATFGAEAKRAGLDIDRIAKARRFASEYTADDVRELCALVVERRSRFSTTSLAVLLRVKDRARRDKMMRQAIRENWSSYRLKRAAQSVRGIRRGHVGRNPKIPSDPIERLLALDALAAKFMKWCSLAGADLPDDLQPSIGKATASLAKVQEAIAKALQEGTTK